MYLLIKKLKNTGNISFLKGKEYLYLLLHLIKQKEWNKCIKRRMLFCQKSPEV